MIKNLTDFNFAINIYFLFNYTLSITLNESILCNLL